MKKHLIVSLALCSAACLFLGGCSSFSAVSAKGTPAVSAEDLTILTIGTADSGGTMYPVGKALAEVISNSDNQIRVNISASNGSSSNVKALMNGDIDLGLVSGDVAFSAVNGTGEFSDAPAEGLSAIAAVYTSLSNWIAPSSLGISYVHDLQGKQIGIGPQDSSSEFLARTALEHMKIDSSNSALTNCGLGSGSELIKEGKLDAIHGFAGIPIEGLSDLAEEIPCTILQYTSEELYAIVRKNSFYCIDVIPAGTYQGQETDIPTFGIKCLLCVNRSMDEDLVYELTKTLSEHTEELSGMHSSLSSIAHKGFMCKDLSIQLHPGAERYYREQHLLPDT